MPQVLKLELHKRSRCSENPEHHTGEKSLLSVTRENAHSNKDPLQPHTHTYTHTHNLSQTDSSGGDRIGS